MYVAGSVSRNKGPAAGHSIGAGGFSRNKGPALRLRELAGVVVVFCVLCGLITGAGCTSPAPAAETGPGPLTYRLQVLINGEGLVELEPPGRDFPVGTVVTLSAYPKSGSRFGYFLYNKKKSATPILRLTMVTDINVVANFAKEQ